MVKRNTNRMAIIPATAPTRRLVPNLRAIENFLKRDLGDDFAKGLKKRHNGVIVEVKALASPPILSEVTVNMRAAAPLPTSPKVTVQVVAPKPTPLTMSLEEKFMVMLLEDVNMRQAKAKADLDRYK